MPDLTIDGLDDAVLAKLEARASLLRMTVGDLARSMLAASMAEPVPPATTAALDAFEQLRAMRAEVPQDPGWNSAAEIRAEREARTARILGEDPEEAWARGYRFSVEAGTAASASRGDVA